MRQRKTLSFAIVMSSLIIMVTAMYIFTVYSHEEKITKLEASFDQSISRTQLGLANTLLNIVNDQTLVHNLSNNLVNSAQKQLDSRIHPNLVDFIHVYTIDCGLELSSAFVPINDNVCLKYSDQKIDALSPQSSLMFMEDHNFLVLKGELINQNSKKILVLGTQLSVDFLKMRSPILEQTLTDPKVHESLSTAVLMPASHITQYKSLATNAVRSTAFFQTPLSADFLTIFQYGLFLIIFCLLLSMIAVFLLRALEINFQKKLLGLINHCEEWAKTFPTTIPEKKQPPKNHIEHIYTLLNDIKHKSVKSLDAKQKLILKLEGISRTLRLKSKQDEQAYEALTQRLAEALKLNFNQLKIKNQVDRTIELLGQIKELQISSSSVFETYKNKISQTQKQVEIWHTGSLNRGARRFFRYLAELKPKQKKYDSYLMETLSELYDGCLEIKQQVTREQEIRLDQSQCLNKLGHIADSFNDLLNAHSYSTTSHFSSIEELIHVIESLHRDLTSFTSLQFDTVTASVSPSTVLAIESSQVFSIYYQLCLVFLNIIKDAHRKIDISVATKIKDHNNELILITSSRINPNLEDGSELLVSEMRNIGKICNILNINWTFIPNLDQYTFTVKIPKKSDYISTPAIDRFSHASRN